MIERIIVMYPTYKDAIKGWNEACSKFKPQIREAKRNPCRIAFNSGLTLFFRGETEGLQVVRGYHASVIDCAELYKIGVIPHESNY